MPAKTSKAEDKPVFFVDRVFSLPLVPCCEIEPIIFLCFFCVYIIIIYYETPY